MTAVISFLKIAAATTAGCYLILWFTGGTPARAAESLQPPIRSQVIGTDGECTIHETVVRVESARTSFWWVRCPEGVTNFGQ